MWGVGVGTEEGICQAGGDGMTTTLYNLLPYIAYHAYTQYEPYVLGLRSGMPLCDERFRYVRCFTLH